MLSDRDIIIDAKLNAGKKLTPAELVIFQLRQKRRAAPPPREPQDPASPSV